MKIEDFRKAGYQMVDEICAYYESLESQPVRPNVAPGYLAPLLPPAAPEEGEAWEDILPDVRSKLAPGMLHWQSPKFFGYFPGNASFPGEKSVRVLEHLPAPVADEQF